MSVLLLVRALHGLRAILHEPASKTPRRSHWPGHYQIVVLVLADQVIGGPGEMDATIPRLGAGTHGCMQASFRMSCIARAVRLLLVCADRWGVVREWCLTHALAANPID
jgi:hypothetical protein